MRNHSVLNRVAHQIFSSVVKKEENVAQYGNKKGIASLTKET
jgi:hypothetical protein